MMDRHHMLISRPVVSENREAPLHKTDVAPSDGSARRQTLSQPLAQVQSSLGGFLAQAQQKIGGSLELSQEYQRLGVVECCEVRRCLDSVGVVPWS